MLFLITKHCKYNSFPKWSSFHSFGQHLPLVIHGLSRLLMFTPFLSTFLPHLPIFTLIYLHSTPLTTFTLSCPHFNHLCNFKLSEVDLLLLPVVTPSYCYYIVNHVSSRFPTPNYPKLHPCRSVSRFFTVTPILHIRVIPFTNILAKMATFHPTYNT